MPVAENILRTLANNPLQEVEADEQAKRVLEQLQTATRTADAAPEPKDDPRDKEVYTFLFDWTDSRGKRWQGEFTTKILNLQEQQAMGVLRTQYQAGAELNALDRATATLNLQLAHLQFSLTKKPSWAANLLTLLDPRLVAEIYANVAEHESFFWRFGAAAAPG